MSTAKEPDQGTPAVEEAAAQGEMDLGEVDLGEADLGDAEDTRDRDRIRSSLDESLIVEAAAGTGKTTVLVDRLVAILAEGRTTVDRVVAVTFTRKAAGELSLRLRQELDRARSASQSQRRRSLLSEAIARLEEAHIGTIHSFCADILRRRPVEAALDPAFVELDESEADGLYAEAFQSWIERRLNDLPPGLSRALRRLSSRPGFDGASPLERLRQAGREMVDWRDFSTPWRRSPEGETPFDRPAALAQLAQRILDLADRSRQGGPKDYLRRALEPVEHLASWISSTGLDSRAGGEELGGGPETGTPRPPAPTPTGSPSTSRDELEALMVDLLRDLRRNAHWKGRGKSFARGLERQAMLDLRQELVQKLEDFDRRAGADLAAVLRLELQEVLQGYDEAKHAVGGVDFLDLLLRCRDLLRTDPGARRDLQDAFTHIFVDEFQDTDPLQAEILLLLAADDGAQTDWRQARPLPGKLFLVGDPKQSIYRFRRADVLLYQAVKDQLIESGVGLVHLSRSFRASAPLQHAVNAAFEEQMTEDRRAGQPAYVPLRGNRQAPDHQPSVVALPAPRPYGWSRISARQVEACQPETVAGFVKWLLDESGWTVADPHPGRQPSAPDGPGPPAPIPPPARIPIKARHICLLFRRFLSWGRDVTDPYLRALEGRGLPHLLVGGRSFHQRQEVETLRAAFTALEWPDDTLSLYATLRGDLFGFADDQLLRWIEGVGPLDPFRLPDASHSLPASLEPLRDSLAFLARLHVERNTVAIAETLHRLLEHTRAQAAFALRPAGNQVLANVQRIADMARAFEIRGGLSFRGFVEQLDSAAARPGAAPAPALEEGADGVRLMTAHTAKGLEFPVVILADLTCQLTAKEPGLYLDAERDLCARRVLGCSPWELLENRQLELERDRAEGVRLAYVATTRARDLLVVPGLGAGPYIGGWTSPLDGAIYPAPADYGRPRPAPGCPPFSGLTVLEGPGSGDPRDQAAIIRPGLHRPRSGEHSVVWWDPSLLDLEPRGPAGVRAQALLEPDPSGKADSEGLERYQDWLDRRAAAIAKGATSSHLGVAVTETEQPPPRLCPIRIESLPRSEGRPAGRRFGTLVHTVLRDIPLDADLEQGEGSPAISAYVGLHARALGANDEEIRAAIEAIRATLAHPLLRRAAQAERTCREMPFQLRLEGDFLIEGTFDLAFLEGDKWTVVDFKTDAGGFLPSEGQPQEADEPPATDASDSPASPRLEAYHRQLAWYAYALSELTGQPVEGVLLGV